ncbi:Regulator of sigma-W protease RasP [subsurface metagenome]
MSIFITIIAFFGILVVVILVHELGHFATAKLSKVKVEEFGLGFPPRLVSFKKGDTRYSLNLIPLGGFCRMAGEEDPKAPGSLAGKSIKTRLLVLSAGSIMNVLLPLLLFSIAFMIPTSLIVGDVMVNEVAPNSPAEEAGIMPGDTILELDGREIRNLNDLAYNTHLNLGAEITLLIGNDTQKEVSLVPRWDPPEGEGAMGVLVGVENATKTKESYPFWEAIPKGTIHSVETMILFKNEIQRWFIAKEGPQVAGPVGIAELTGEAARSGFGVLLEFTAFLSMNLAIINLLPIPGLDGGRIVFVAIEGIRRGKKISPKREGLVHLIGFTVLILIIILITYQDILRIIRGESLIP